MAGNIKPIINPTIEFTQLFIDNKYVNSKSGKTFATINPTTGVKIADIQEADQFDVELAITAAKAAFKRGSVWRKMNASDRGLLLYRLADLIEADKIKLASLETLDNGKPFTQAYNIDMVAGINHLRYYGGMADKIVGQTLPSDNTDLFCYTRKEPVGVVGAIVPRNFPLMLCLAKIAPAIAAGCTIIIKPAEQTPITAVHLGSLIVKAGFPPGVINILPGYGPSAGAALVNHRDINKITFTGSTEVGKLILNGSANSNLKRITLELGGKSPNIIFPDVDLDYAVEASSDGIMFNMGQVCCAGSRTYVHESIYDAFVKKSVELAKKRTVGNPFEMVDNGPQVDETQMNRILELIESGKKEGAKMLCGGSRAGDNGYFIQPTVFCDVTANMRIAKEEIFGPVQSIFKFKDIDEVIDLANDTEYGLAAAVFTKNIDTAITVANALEAGTVWVNTYGDCSSQNPFGGYKLSGQGREFGFDGIEPFLETKTVVIRIKN